MHNNDVKSNDYKYYVIFFKINFVKKQKQIKSLLSHW